MCIYYGHTPDAYQHLSPLKRAAKRLVGNKSIFYTPLLRGDRLGFQTLEFYGSYLY